MCSPQTFTLTADQYFKLISAMAAAGCVVVGQTGHVVYRGCTFNWNYTTANGLLVISCIDKPWYAPCSSIASRITAFIAGISN